MLKHLIENHIENLNTPAKQYLALNPNTPTQTLNVLADDENWEARYYVVLHPNTPIQNLEETLLTNTDDQGTIHAQVLKQLLEKTPTLNTIKIAVKHVHNPQVNKQNQVTVALKLIKTLKNLQHLNPEEQHLLQDYLSEKHNIALNIKTLKTKNRKPPVEKTPKTCFNKQRKQKFNLHKNF